MARKMCGNQIRFGGLFVLLSLALLIAGLTARACLGQAFSEVIPEVTSLGDIESPPWTPENRNLAFGGSVSDWLQLDTPYTFAMLDFQNRQGDKENFLLRRAQTQFAGPGVVFGAQFRPSAIIGRTNRENKFNYLGRFPADFSGNTATDIRLLQANQGLTLQANSFTHAYIETLYSDVFSFPAFNQGSFQVRQAYVVFGDLNRSPFYGFIGKKNISFGDFSTLSPFTQAIPWHYFAPLAEGAGIGFDNERILMTLTAINGSRGIRVADSDRKGVINNFATNLLIRTPLSDSAHFNIGAGYLHGTIYDAGIAEHINPEIQGPINGAVNVHTHLQWNSWEFAGEYVQTLHAWPVTGSQVIAYRTEAAYQTVFWHRPMRYSFSWSDGRQGPVGSEFEFNQQLVLGSRYNLTRDIFVTAEYVRGRGFAPLINITTVSDRDVIQNSLVLGCVIAL